jgi:hypothetical protein
MLRPRCPALTLSRLRRLWTNTKGVAAVEFAMLAPLLLMMTFGTIELSRALIIHKRFQRAASMVGDLVTRETQLWPVAENDDPSAPDPKVSSNWPHYQNESVQNLNGIMTAAAQAMLPYTPSPLSITVYQVWANPTNAIQTKLEWKYSYSWSKGTFPSSCTNATAIAKTIDQNVLQGGGRAVFVEATYTYTPLFANLLPQLIRQMTWTDTMVMAPRDMPSVLFRPGLNNGADWNDNVNVKTIVCPSS